MTCEQIQAELVAYLDGELAKAGRQRVEEHLAVCADCRAARDALAAAGDAVRTLPATEASADFAPRFWERHEKERDRGPVDRVLGWMRRPLPGLALTAGVAASVLAVVMLLRPGAKPVAGPDERIIATHLGLFRDYEVIENLDLLEDLEFIEALDDEV